MIAIIDYGMGNLGSIKNMLSRIGVESVITSDPKVIAEADRLILPGVGAFDHAMANLDRLGLIPLLNERVLDQKVPLLGICLGMQLLTRGSEEGSLRGLGWIEAETVRFRFPEDSGLRVPHMGWNTFDVKQRGTILDDLPGESRFYFVHSYYVRCTDGKSELATTTYGHSFASAVVRDNILGMQFHPEKSHRYGLRLLSSFAGVGR